jgi:hypothetical protein
MNEQQPRRPAPGVPPRALPHGGAAPAEPQRLAEPQPLAPAGAERRAYGRRIDCTPDAPREPGASGRHR